MENLNSKTLPVDFAFEQIPNLFTGSTSTFFFHICIDKNVKWYKNIVSDVIETYKDPSEQLHRLAETIRVDVIEAEIPTVEKLNPAYKDILMSAIYECDSFAIAKELMRQYKEKLSVAEVN